MMKPTDFPLAGRVIGMSAQHMAAKLRDMGMHQWAAKLEADMRVKGRRTPPTMPSGKRSPSSRTLDRDEAKRQLKGIQRRLRLANPQARYAAYHEGGHCVAVEHHGGTVLNSDLSWNGRWGETHWLRRHTCPAAAASVTFCGAMAECKFRRMAWRDPEVYEARLSAGDRAVLEGINSDDQQEGRRLAEMLCSTYWSKIRRAAMQLLEDGQISA